MIACLCAFIGNTNRNPLVLFKETENRRNLLARDVVGALISSYWAHGRLEVPEKKWVRTNNYKFHTFRLLHFDPCLSPRPSFRFSEGLVPRLMAQHLKPPGVLDPKVQGCIPQPSPSTSLLNLGYKGSFHSTSLQQ